MTSKKLFFNMMKEDVKHRIWVVALTFLTFFFMLPVPVAIFLSRANELPDSPAVLANGVRFVLELDYDIVVVLFVLLSLLLGSTSFSWLHSKKKVDFYHSLPISRVKLFFVNYLDGIFILFFSYVLNMLLSLLIAAANGVAQGSILWSALGALGFQLLHFAMLYSITVLAMVMTGHILVGLLGTCVFHLYFPILISVLYTLFLDFIKTAYHGGGNAMLGMVAKSSALTLYIDNFAAVKTDPLGWGMAFRVSAVIIITAAVTAVSLLFYRLRGSEAAGKAMAFRASRIVIRVPIVILSSLCGGLFFWEIRNSLAWSVFGILCGFLLSHGTIETIYHFNFMKLFSDWISMVACGVAGILIFCGFYFDLFGYDRYIPKQSSIESAAISFPNMETWVDYRKMEATGHGTYDWKYESQDDYIFSHMEISDTSTVLALVKEAVNQAEKGKWGDGVSFSVKFKRTNGTNSYRSYQVSRDAAYDLIKEVFGSRGYRMAAYPLMEQTPEETRKIKVKQGGWIKEAARKGSQEQDDMVDQLLSAYQGEMAGLSADVMEKENPIACIQFMKEGQANEEEKNGKSGSYWGDDRVINGGYYPVYPSFAKTIELLARCGIELEAEICGEAVTEADIKLDRTAKSDRTGDGSQIAFTDSEELAALMKTARLDDYLGMNPFSSKEGRISFYTEARGSGWKNEYSIRMEDAPKFLKKALDEAGAQSVYD